MCRSLRGDGSDQQGQQFHHSLGDKSSRELGVLISKGSSSPCSRGQLSAILYFLSPFYLCFILHIGESPFYSRYF